MPVVGKENTLMYDIWGEHNYLYITVSTLTARIGAPIFSFGVGEIVRMNWVNEADSPVFFSMPLFPIAYTQWEAEDGTLTGSSASVILDTLAFNKKVVQLGATDDEITITLDYFEGVLPAGKYHLAIRTWMSGITGDETLNVRVVEDDYATPTDIYDDDHIIPIESAYGESWIVIEDVDFDFVKDYKYEFHFKRTTTGTANPIFVDCFVLIPVERSSVSGQKQNPLHFCEGELGVATMALKEVRQRPSKDKRRGTT
jgi:hypothetical protein